MTKPTHNNIQSAQDQQRADKDGQWPSQMGVDHTTSNPLMDSYDADTETNPPKAKASSTTDGQDKILGQSHGEDKAKQKPQETTDQTQKQDHAGDAPDHHEDTTRWGDNTDDLQDTADYIDTNKVTMTESMPEAGVKKWMHSHTTDPSCSDAISPTVQTAKGHEAPGTPKARGQRQQADAKSHDPKDGNADSSGARAGTVPPEDEQFATPAWPVAKGAAEPLVTDQPVDVKVRDLESVARNLPKAVLSLIVMSVAGIDGIRPRQLKKIWPQIAVATIEAIRDDLYEWSPLHTIFFPKPAGGLRPISIPTALDRAVALAIVAVLESLSDSMPNQFAYLKGRGPHRAIFAAARYALDISYDGQFVAISVDISEMFCSIPHSLVVKILRAAGVAKGLIDLILGALRRTSISSDGNVMPSTPGRGLAQGCPLSAFLAVLVLHHLIGHLYTVAYADDVLVLLPMGSDADAVIAEIQAALSVHGMSLKQAKTSITTGAFAYLGLQCEIGTGDDGEPVATISPDPERLDSVIASLRSAADEMVCMTRRWTADTARAYIVHTLVTRTVSLLAYFAPLGHGDALFAAALDIIAKTAKLTPLQADGVRAMLEDQVSWIVFRNRLRLRGEDGAHDARFVIGHSVEERTTDKSAPTDGFVPGAKTIDTKNFWRGLCSTTPWSVDVQLCGSCVVIATGQSTSTPTFFLRDADAVYTFTAADSTAVVEAIGIRPVVCAERRDYRLVMDLLGREDVALSVFLAEDLVAAANMLDDNGGAFLGAVGTIAGLPDDLHGVAATGRVYSLAVDLVTMMEATYSRYATPLPWTTLADLRSLCSKLEAHGPKLDVAQLGVERRALLDHIGPDGRVQPLWRTVARNGRIHSSAPNIQAQLKSTDPALITDEGKVCVSFDLVQADLVSLAIICLERDRCSVLRDLLASGFDAYVWLASRLLDRVDGVLSPQERTLGKRVFLAVINGQGTRRLAEQLDEITGREWSLDAAARLSSELLTRFPGVQAFLAADPYIWPATVPSPTSAPFARSFDSAWGAVRNIAGGREHRGDGRSYAEQTLSWVWGWIATSLADDTVYTPDIVARRGSPALRRRVEELPVVLLANGLLVRARSPRAARNITVASTTALAIQSGVAALVRHGYAVSNLVHDSLWLELSADSLIDEITQVQDILVEEMSQHVDGETIHFTMTNN